MAIDMAVALSGFYVIYLKDTPQHTILQHFITTSWHLRYVRYVHAGDEPAFKA